MVNERIRSGRATGTFVYPEYAGPFPAVLALGGSDGGTPEYFVNLLCREGVAVLALTYWGTPDTQMNMAEIPLERVEDGLRWLASRPNVRLRDGRVGIVGASKGAELALLAAASFPELVGPVVAYTASSVVWMGVDFAQPGRACSSWTRNGAAVPYVPFPPNVFPSQSARGLSMVPIFERGLENRSAVSEASIPIERAAGPIMLVSGGKDGVWPSGRMCGMLVDRMAGHGRDGDVVHRHFPDAGHMLFPYSLPADGHAPPFPMDLGGTAEADAAAHASTWAEVVTLFRG